MAEARIPAGEFKAHCLRLMDEVQAKRRPIVITKRGKPVARLVPIEDEPVRLFGALKGTVSYCGDVISPTGEVWEADA